MLIVFAPAKLGTIYGMEMKPRDSDLCLRLHSESLVVGVPNSGHTSCAWEHTGSLFDSVMSPHSFCRNVVQEWIFPLVSFRVMWRDWESSRHICKSLLDAKAYTQLVDFDVHLDDIREDWTNQKLNTEIAQLVSVANGSA